MTRAELLLWPAANNWGASRRAALEEHTAFYLTLYPDESTCAIWSDVVDQCRRAGQPIQTADAWIAASARQWGCPLTSATLDACSSAPSAAATWRWRARSGGCSVRADIRSTSRGADMSTCSNRRSGDRSSRATRLLPSRGGGDCTIAA